MFDVGKMFQQNKNLLQHLKMYLKCNQWKNVQLNPMLLSTSINCNETSAATADRKDLEIIKSAIEVPKNVMLQYHHKTQSSMTSFVLNTNPQAVLGNKFPAPHTLPLPSETPCFDESEHSTSSSDVFHASPPVLKLPNIEFGDVGTVDRNQFEGPVVNNARPVLASSKSDPNNSPGKMQKHSSKERCKTDSDLHNHNENDVCTSSQSAASFFVGPPLSTKCLRNVFKTFIKTRLPQQNSWFTFIRFGLELSDQDINHILEDFKDNAFARKFSLLEKWAEGKTFETEDEVMNLLDAACRASM
uniref:Protein Red-like n=1 Tax=Phallusia mammillata TaxID=59560 RepID=A0A6F9DFQ8_9ASCI|nr:protein Red-like [Phallusia mammillata]